MAYQVETPGEWPLGVYQIAVTDPVLGGADGPANVMGRHLANRAAFQRLRNVTPWLADLAAAHGYPAGACVRHGANTWRAIVDNNVAPGTDGTKWERWGYSESELDAKLAALLPYGEPVACPNSGPVAEAEKTKIHKSALGEYWMWLGDAWGVVWGRYGSYYNNGAAGAAVASGSKVFNSITAPRNGVVNVTVSVRMVAAAVGNTVDVSIDLGGVSVVSDAIVATVVGQGMYTSAAIQLPVTAGQVLRQSSYSNYGGTAFIRASAYYSN